MKTALCAGALLVFAGCSPSELSPGDAYSGARGADDGEMLVCSFQTGWGAASARSQPLPAAQITEAVFGTPVPANARVARQWTGEFTAAQKPQTLALITRGEPLSAPDATARSMLAVFENGRLVAQFVPPDPVYHDAPCLVDANSDGLDDVVLAVHGYQMGQVSVYADVLTLAGGQRRKLSSLGTVYENNCDVPGAEPTVTATALFAAADGTLSPRRYRADCPAPGEALALSSFQPLAAHAQ